MFWPLQPCGVPKRIRRNSRKSVHGRVQRKLDYALEEVRVFKEILRAAELLRRSACPMRVCLPLTRSRWPKSRFHPVEILCRDSEMGRAYGETPTKFDEEKLSPRISNRDTGDNNGLVWAAAVSCRAGGSTRKRTPTDVGRETDEGSRTPVPSMVASMLATKGARARWFEDGIQVPAHLRG